MPFANLCNLDIARDTVLIILWPETAMAKWDTATPYDQIAGDYDQMRKPGRATTSALQRVLSSVPSDGVILSVGCGTGQYEEVLGRQWKIFGVDKSESMLRIARTRLQHCVHADMLDLPFDDRTFDAVYFVQSLHHAGGNLESTAPERDSARIRALREAVRVLKSGPLAIVQRDPSQNAAVWIWKYFPEALERKLILQTSVATLSLWLKNLGLTQVTAEPLQDTMLEGFFDPKAPLDPAFQRAYSDFSYLSETELQAGMSRLRAAIDDGSVVEVIEAGKQRFAAIGGTIFLVHGVKQA